MSGRLRMYNVQFGDAFLLYGEGENLLVDLGSIGTINFDPIRDSIRNECENLDFSLLLTHFHKDHWSGLCNQPPCHQLPRVKLVYLPDIFGMRFAKQLDVIVRGLLGDFLESVVLRKKPQFTLADLLRNVLPKLPRKQIRFLRRGDIFQMGGRSYEVLWPRLLLKDAVGKQSRALIRFLEQTEAKLTADRSEARLLDTMEALANVLLRDFANSLDYPRDSLPPVIRAEERTYEELYRQAQRMSELLSRELQINQKEYLDKVRRYAEQLSRDWNRVSLVFQEQSGAEERLKNDGILMTSDVPGPTLKQLANGVFGKPYLQDGYAVIKAPHHGTDTHFCAILPRSQHLCISNGTGNRKFHRIADEYEHVYGLLGKGAEIHCTNRRCNFWERKRKCPFFSKYPAAASYDVCW